jgi:transcriptional regulator with XRE-family HTH domain
MTGKQLKDILYRTGISFTEISKRLGITPQGLNNNLLVNDVKTGLLERICDVLDMDITDFIPSKKMLANIENSVLGDGNNNVNNNTDATLLRIMERQSEQITTAQQQTTTAQQQITDLISILKTK